MLRGDIARDVLRRGKGDKLMEYIDFIPEEKLLFAIFGGLDVPQDEYRHFLSPEGKEVVNRVLEQCGDKGSLPTIRSRGTKVIRLRFGLEPRTVEEKIKRPGSDSRTLDEVGVYFGVTRERIRQIEKKMLRTLRYPKYARELKPLLPRGW